MWVEFHVEEPSMEAALNVLIPRISNNTIQHNIINYSSKQSLIKKLPNRMRALRHFIQHNMKYVVVVDQDDNDCIQLKQDVTNIIKGVGLVAKEQTNTINDAQVFVRIPVEELEAWFLGDFVALNTVFPRIPITAGTRTKFRDPDNVTGGTWEALQRLLQQYGYYAGGLPKIEVANRISPHLSLTASRSTSFRVFVKLVNALSHFP